MAVAFLIALIAVAIYAYLHVDKDLAHKDMLCESAWETLGEQLERRNALVPQLVEGAPTDSDEQAETLSYLSRMQAAVSSATTPEAKMSSSAELTSVLNTILTSLEIQPDLKEELDDVDVKLTYARASYNDRVYDYNVAITTFPGKLVARSRYRPRQSFDAVGDTARQQAIQ